MSTIYVCSFSKTNTRSPMAASVLAYDVIKLPKKADISKKWPIWDKKGKYREILWVT